MLRCLLADLIERPFRSPAAMHSPLRAWLDRTNRSSACKGPGTAWHRHTSRRAAPALPWCSCQRDGHGSVSLWQVNSLNE